ncbi:hypothetical protein HY440_03740 [Candidatus Microgenomates bacterium]|nr:hypothetical protein [Candidatus Microgenomates bacterium]
MTEKLEQIALFILAGLVFLLPLFFLPTQVDWFDLPKASLLLLGSLLSLTLWLFHSILANKLSIIKSVFFFPMALLAAASAASALFSDNKIASLASDPVVYAGSLLLLVLVTQAASKEKLLRTLLLTILGAGAVLAILSIIQNVIGLVPAFKNLAPTTFLFNQNFSPTGSALSQAIFLAILVPVAIGFYWHSNKSKINLGLLVLIGAGLVSTIFAMYRSSPVLLPATAGWRIAANTLGQSVVFAFFGTGPGNFIDAFTANKPLDFNNLPIWNLRFTTSSNFYFYLLTTTGIAGLAAFLLLTAKIVILARKRLQSETTSPLEKGLLGSLVVALVLFALLPAPIAALVAFATLLGLLTGLLFAQENMAYVKEIPDVTAGNSLARPGLSLVTLVVLGLLGFYLGKFLLADNAFAASLAAAAANRGTDTYNLQIKATTLNPWNDSYRISYSQTNLALANALAGSPNLTDQQKQTVVALVQQALRESRNAVALAPKRAGDYENLSLIYRNLINFAQGADQWAIASQNQAINLDPINPRLRLDLGGIYFAAQDYQTAGQAFAAAVNLKADYANAHYNLAQAMKQLNLKDQATQQLQLTASLICTGANTQSADCKRVNDEIAGMTPAPVATPGANLTPPQPATPSNLPKAQTKPPVKVASPEGVLAQ